jgi:hypothetical protein
MFSPWLILILGTDTQERQYFINNVLHRLLWFHIKKHSVNVVIREVPSSHHSIEIDEIISRIHLHSDIFVLTAASDKYIDMRLRQASDLIVFTDESSFNDYFSRCSYKKDKEYEKCISTLKQKYSEVIFDKSNLTLYSATPVIA